jgi:3-deoxy-D-manno-octulosonic acid kinase
MFKKIPIPASFTLLKKRNVFLLLREDYRDFLLQEGIDEIETYLAKHRETASYLRGRTIHPSIPLKGGERMVIRHYSHGGLLRFFTRDLYLFGSRSFQELALTEEIRSSGIGTVQPVGAMHRCFLTPFYRAYLMSLEIPGAKDMVHYLQNIGPQPAGETLVAKRKIIRSAGFLLRKFHQAGFFHADLQLKNLLVTDGKVLLIDFDRSYRKPSLSTGERVKNLLRLDRSVDKWKRYGLPVSLRDRWRFFLAYAESDREIRETLRRALRTYSIRSFFHRLRWSL